MYNITKYVCELIQEKCDSKIEPEFEMVNLGLSSIDFITIIVYIENEYQIQFEDEYLVMSRFDTIKDLCKYVVERINTTGMD